MLTVDAVRQAGIGHVGLPLGCADIGVLLFSEFLKHDPARPDWFDRDRFVLSAGHGSMLLYSLLHLSGYDLSLDEIRRFRQLGLEHAGHPEHGLTPGVETTTGPLGQGLGNAVGMALAERMLAARFGSELVDHRTYALASDGDMMEGVAQRGLLARRAPRPGQARRPLRRQPRHHRRTDLALLLRGRRRDASRRTAGTCSASTATRPRRCARRSSARARPRIGRT